MKKLLVLFFCAIFLFAAQSRMQAQTWNLTATMTATLDSNGVLTISTTKAEGEAMPDHYNFPSDVPWFDVCNNIQSAVIENNVTTIGIYAFFTCTNLASVTIPNSVTTIGSYAFASCTNLASVTFPNSVSMIEDRAFLRCTGLLSVTIPSSVITLGRQPFFCCTALMSIHVDPGNPAYSSDTAGVLYNNSKTTLLEYPAGKSGTFTIPNSVTTIESSAFYSCSGLTSVSIPNSVTKIGDSAFLECTGLSSVTIPSSVTAILETAFAGCSGLTDVTVEWATPLTYPDIIPNAFNGIDPTTTLHVPVGTKALYEANYIWGTFFGTIVEATIAVTGVSLNKTTVSLYVDDTDQLTTTISPSNATNQGVNWSSSNSSIATVSATGLVTAVDAGTATITVTTDDGGFTATCTVTVTVSVTEVSLNQTTVELIVGNALQLTATVAPANASNKTVTWSSDNPSVATVSATGLVTAKSEGSTTITVTTDDGGFTADCTVSVSVSITGVSLNQTAAELIVGNTLQLTATVAPANASNKTVTWSSGNPSVATVSATGLVTAVSEGTAIIAVVTEDGDFTALCNVKVSKLDIQAEEENPVGEDRTGKIVLSLTIPANILFSGTFKLTLPNGVQLDLSVTKLADDWGSQLTLVVVQEADGSWTFTITPLDLRSFTEMVYSRIVEIGYTIDETVTIGKHEATISNLSFEFENGATITEGKIPVIITVNDSQTGIPELLENSTANISNGRLNIQSPVAETVQICSIHGMLISNFQKQAGEASYPLNQMKGTVLIVKGSSGWVKKIIAN